MSSFSIDDVRDSFTADVSQFLTRIQREAQAALGARALEPSGSDRPGFAMLGDLGHAIYGTSGLVGASSLHESARALEDLARLGEAEVAKIEEAQAKARAIAKACGEGVAHMRRMLFIELDHRGPDALALAKQWKASLTQLLDAPAPAEAAPTAPKAPEVEAPEEVFQFGEDVEEIEDDGTQAPSATGFRFEDADGQTELLEIFRAEGRETVRALAAEMASLRAKPGNVAALGNVERLFHTLKGAAATVGLVEISKAAATIQERLEDELERGVTITAERVEALAAEASKMLAHAGLPPLAPPAAPPADPARATAHGFFLEEVQDLQREAHGLVDELASSSAETSLHARHELGRLFHRLKGSAFLVGENRVGGEAEKVQAVFEPEGTVTAANEDLALVARSALTRISAFLGNEAPASVSITAPPPGAHAAVRETVTVAAEPELWDAFTQESGELMDSLERECLALEDSSQPRQLLEKVMNLLHTLKGVMNTIGLGPTAKQLHRVEDFVETLLKAPILPPMRAVASLLLKVKSDVRRNLGESKHGYVETSMPRLEARIARVLAPARGKADAAPASQIRGGSVAGMLAQKGASVHSITDARSAKSVSRSGPSDGVNAGSSRAEGNELVDRRFIRVGTERLDSLMNLAGELVVSRSRLLDRVGNLRSLQKEIGRGSRRLVEAVDEFRESYEYAGVDGKSKQAPQPPPAIGGAQAWYGFGELELDRYEDIHILSRRLAEIVSDVTELSVQLAKGLTTFSDDSQGFDAIVSGIQSEVSRARMVPLDLLFSRLRLPVRDAATRETKEVRVAIEGADVTLDKTISDGLFTPMLHLVRNAVVHGVESAAARQAAGKPVVGVVTLAARQASGQIVLEVKDDGGGLDLEALRARGAKLGLCDAELPLTDPTVRELVFAPGLSTRTEAGAVSGRGVGCDVVRRAVERMNGTIQVESEAGKGTTFTITLPVTLAITKALIVRQSGRSYAFPLHFAERILDTESDPLVESAGVRRLKIDDAFLAVTRFEQHLGAPSRANGAGPVLLLRVGDQRAALQVDAVIGQEEVVVKSLGDVLGGHPLFAGVTMRGSGELVLIVDVPGLMETKARRIERTAAAAEAKPAKARVSPAAAAPAKKARTRVLFVDDSLSVRKYAELTFAGLGVDVTLAVDGIDALARLRSESFDLVFTDLEMPRMHGFELIRELRFVPAYKDLPIIVVTSRSGQKHKQQARALGATEYLTKPFSAQAVAEILGRFVKAPEGGVRGVPS